MDPSTNREVFTVSRLNKEARGMLEQSFGLIWLEGEISNFTHHGSGHMYFSLKDDKAQVSCAMFRGQNNRLRFRPAEGMLVLVHAKVSIYEARGNFQLIVESMEEAGEGRLQREFERLKKKLLDAGLFDPDHKQPLPAVPKKIGIVTSPTGAAIRDILHVLKRRFPAAAVLVYPVAVQGEAAAGQIVRALELAAAHDSCDLLILARGGGSLEDLWAFNEEAVARAIFDCPLPLITGIGHEIDFTIADFVADVRAPTPSAAAEIAVPEQREWLNALAGHLDRLRSLVQRYLSANREKTGWLQKRLARVHPGQLLNQQGQKLDELGLRLRRVAADKLGQMHKRLDPLARALQAIGPQATLERGYAIVSHGDAIVRDAGMLKKGDEIQTRFARGTATSTVKETKKR
ncbi:MAG: exodeoxyribonuclease VII large subunit [Gammaproteobacteria bacterium]|nr:exodeoxyribonuclease VII large subunit [Gammaproteobacteria bacterium]